MVLTVLYPTFESDQQVELHLDIVAVHGLGGDSIETWAGPNPNASWLQEFLPLDVKDSRVLTFGYNADWAFGNTTADTRDHAKDLLSDLVDERMEEEEARRPIIFIAHSLGGIIVKQALLLARIEHRYQSIYQHTIGITFFGTPHRGSEIADYGGVLAKIATTIMRKPASKLVRALKSNSDELMQLTSDFRHQIPQYDIVSFFELKPMGIPNSLIVDKKSALLEVFGEDQIPVDANHRDMCKFGTRKDATYGKLFKRIRRTLDENNAQGVNAGLSVCKPFNKYYDVPYNVSSVFTGREDICHRLCECCLPSGPQSAQREQKRFVLFGGGGFGKTQLCLKFAQDQREKFWAIFFIDASSINTADQGFLRIAQYCRLGQEVDIAKRWLANSDKPWLLILDNADDPSMDISKYFPTGGRGTILITSRNPGCTAYSSVGSSEIASMALEDAITLLLRVSEEEDVRNESLRKLAKRVVETLGCLALAIVHAGALIKQKLYDLEDYCEAYSRNRHRLFGHQTIPAQIGYKHMVYTTWEISIEMIRKLPNNNPTNSSCWSSKNVENALDLLNIFSVLHMDNIPLEILESAWKQWKQESSDGKLSDWTKSHQPRVLCQDYAGDWDPFTVSEAVLLLSSFSLIRINDSSHRISLHPLVHAWIRDRLTQSKRAGCWITAVSLLSASYGDSQYVRSLIPHINSCLEFIDDELLFAEGTGTTERLWIAHTFAIVYCKYGDYKKAFEILIKALELCKKTYAAHGEISLQLERELAIVYDKLGTYSKAVDHQERVLQISLKMFGREHPTTLDAKSYLATFYNRIGRESKAIEMHKDVLHTSGRALGDKHVVTLDIMQRLAESYCYFGQYQAAIKLQEKELHLRKNLFHYEDSAVLLSMEKLAFFYGQMGRYKESLQLNEETLQLRKKMLGEEHPDTLESMSSLAISYKDLNRTQEAVELNEATLQLTKKILGDEHPHTLFSMSNLALCYQKLNRTQEALELNEETLQLKKKILGDEDPHTLFSMSNLALCYQKLNRTQEALELNEETLQLTKKILGDEHPGTLTSMSSLAISYANVGRNEEALGLLTEAVDAGRRTLGEEHPDTIYYTSWLNHERRLQLEYRR